MSGGKGWPVSQRSILLIDPFPSAKYLSDTFRRLGVHTTALYTAADVSALAPYLRPHPDYFDEQILVGSRRVEDILAAVGERGVDYVLNGDEGSVDVTDQVAHHLTPGLGNDPATSALRMDKLLMHQAVASRGLAHIRQQRLGPDGVDLDGADIADVRWPCFIKPARGMGSKGVAKLTSHADFVSYFDTIDIVDLLGKIGTATPDESALTFLLCEFVEGTECFVDTFSHLGTHYIASVQHYRKVMVDGSPIYRYAELETDRELASRVGDYVCDVLTSVGVQNGFAHTEVFVRADGEPVLIEVNPRASGAQGFANRLVPYEGRLSQPELLNAVLFEHLRDAKYVAPETRHGRMLFLFHFSQDPLPDLAEVFKRYRTVETFKQIAPTGQVHSQMPRSVFELVALAACRSDDPAQMVEESDAILAHDLAGW